MAQLFEWLNAVSLEAVKVWAWIGELLEELLRSEAFLNALIRLSEALQQAIHNLQL